MQNSASLFTSIVEIGNEPSKNAKLLMLIDFVSVGGALARSVLDYAYNPFKTYGVKRIPHVENSATKSCFDSETFALLDKLIKRELTGNAAQEAIARELAALDVESSELLKRVLLKDLRAGFGVSSINKAVKGLIPTFPYMRCSLPTEVDLDKWGWERGVVLQIKADGMFANVNNDTSGASLTSRQGTPIVSEQLASIIEDVEKGFAMNTQSHGEIVVVKDGVVLAREIGNGILNSVIQGGTFPPGTSPRLEVWDQIPLEAVKPKGKFETPYIQRLKSLKQQIFEMSSDSVKLIYTKIVKSKQEAFEVNRDLMLKGLEGSVIKRPEMIWRDHTSPDQVKLKLSFECELEVTDFVAGNENGKHKNTFGSLRTRSSCGSLVVDVSGFKDAKRKEIWQSKEAWIGRIITVRSNAILYSEDAGKPHSLFLPRFIEERLDKPSADDMTRIQEQYKNAIDQSA